MSPAADVLARFDLFAGLDAAALADVAASGRRRATPAGGTFFCQGDPATTFYVLLDGRVRLSQVTADGQQVVLHMFGPGDGFALVAVLTGMPYPATAEAVEDAAAMGWTVADYHALATRHPRLTTNVVALMGARVREFQDRMRELATERVERRIARAVLRLASQTGRKVDDGVLVDVPLTRQDLAELTGTTLFTVSRTLKDWEARGVVRAGRKRVVIREPHRLVAIAEGLGGSPR